MEKAEPSRLTASLELFIV